MKSINPWLLIPCAILTFIPVPLWNSWSLDYINENGKLVAWLLAPVFAFLATVVFLGTSTIRLPILSKGKWNYFYGWLICELAIEILIVALSNT